MLSFVYLPDKGERTLSDLTLPNLMKSGPGTETCFEEVRARKKSVTDLSSSQNFDRVKFEKQFEWIEDECNRDKRESLRGGSE